ncbi:vWA domain-containing protein [Agarivorans albus]|uniref:von Willebrand factor type A domain protein n=1 Tax=Agarivorans albus MKT 106 TaxID=1331007 RepID=R9PP26_AGAAL|nr:VWA domain-containing protein [Agarivorans albus]GAD03147.1 von Willebrand factor type A domain protein [Agarivorans albus MKT 106]
MQKLHVSYSPIARAVLVGLTLSSLVACGQYSADEQANVDRVESQQQNESVKQTKPAQRPQQDQSIKAVHPIAKHQREKRAVSQMQTARTSNFAAAQGLADSSYYYEQGNNENYQKFSDLSVVAVAEQPVSTFSADVDSASYANMRRFINNGQLPPKDAVRVEELINYFSYDYATGNDAALSIEQPIAIDTLLTASPWNSNNQLIRIGVSAYKADTSIRPAANVVFLVDVSGSMQSQEKLPLLKQSMLLMLNNLKASDNVAIVTYASGTGVALRATSVKDKHKIVAAINGLQAGGSTNGSAGIELAYNQAQQGFIEGGINHVYLMSDGDLNVGITDIDELKHRITQKRKAGVQFSTIGFGTGNYNDHLMEQLADNGNGVAGYIDTLHEAQKLLVDQLGSSLHTVAHDVKFQVEFNPRMVSEYRLLGYENRQLERADFNNDKKDAGDMGAGHSVTAIYEITPVGKPGLIDPLVFQQQKQNKMAKPQVNEALAEVRVRYKKAQSQASEKYAQRVFSQDLVDFEQANNDDRFAIAVAAFGQKLRANEQLDELAYQQIIDWANAAKGQDKFGYRAEFVKLARLTNTLALQSPITPQPQQLPELEYAVQPLPVTLPARIDANNEELSQ